MDHGIDNKDNCKLVKTLALDKLSDFVDDAATKKVDFLGDKLTDPKWLSEHLLNNFGLMIN